MFQFCVCTHLGARLPLCRSSGLFLPFLCFLSFRHFDQIVLVNRCSTQWAFGVKSVSTDGVNNAVEAEHMRTPRDHRIAERVQADRTLFIDTRRQHEKQFVDKSFFVVIFVQITVIIGIIFALVKKILDDRLRGSSTTPIQRSNLIRDLTILKLSCATWCHDTKLCYLGLG